MHLLSSFFLTDIILRDVYQENNRYLQDIFSYDIGMRLKLAQIMEKRKISKYRLAQMLGVPTASVFRYFKPGYDPKLSTLENIANALGLKIRDLLDE